VKCGICGEFDEADNFSCPNCDRDNLCGSHYDFDFLVCTECADKMRPAAAKKTAAKKQAAASAQAPAEVPAAAEESPDKNPFYIQKVKCPVCDAKNDQRWFHAKIFSERNVDLDKHVGKYMWADKSFKRYLPNLYYIWHCNNCHYTDSYLTYENPMKDTFNNFRFLKEAFIDQYHDDPRIEKIINKLGENIDYNKMHHYQAIKLHLLAIYIQELMEEVEEQDVLKIGRYYLRLGWLFRELSADKNVSDKVKITLTKLIEFLKKGWEGVPGNEIAAMKEAIKYLNLAFTHSQAITSIVAEVDLLMLIAGVHLKIDEQERGLKILNTVLARGQKTKQRLEQKIKESDKSETPLSAEEIRRFDVQLKKLDAIMSSARDIMGDLKSAKMKKIRQKAKDIVKSLGSKPPEAIRAILIKKGIDKRIAEELTPIEKKKFLGLF
jgi:uncharacterized protein (DUF2225 family)